MTLGITAVLHTWSQKLLGHYHLHCVVTGGGPSLDGGHWVPLRPEWLFPVRALSIVFRAKFRDGLKQLFGKGDKFQELLEAAAREAHESVRLAIQVMKSPRDTRSFDELVLARRKEKKISEQISEELVKTFVTGLEREDIESLANRLYRIPKSAEKLA